MNGADGAFSALTRICNVALSQNEQMRNGAQELASCAKHMHTSVSLAASLLSDSISALEAARFAYDEAVHKSSVRLQSPGSPKISAKLAAYEAEVPSHFVFFIAAIRAV